MIRLQNLDGSPVAVNPATVAWFTSADGNTALTFIGGSFLTVRDPFDAVAELFDPQQPGPAAYHPDTDVDEPFTLAQEPVSPPSE
jgi:uncharacterized protein YlzI (FlbEa/FlbD family)